MSSSSPYAPGWPGLPARWTSSAKEGVGTANNSNSRVWFTLSHGIFNEVYYPRLDQACTRDMGLIVTDGHDFFSEEKRHATHELQLLANGVPGYRLTNSCEQGLYRIEKEIIADPYQDAVLQNTRFTPLKGRLDDYHLHVLLAPHIGNQGAGNTAWVGQQKGVTMLFAQRDGIALALACSVPWLKTSVGFVGASDGWQDLSQHKQMTWSYQRAENGNVALTAEIDLSAGYPHGNTEFLLALGFGSTPAEAGFRALTAMALKFSAARSEYIRQWQEWQQALLPLDNRRIKTVEIGGTSQGHWEDQRTPEEAQSKEDLYRISIAVMRVHEAKAFAGGIIASLSIPWGFANGDHDLGGYHLVWPRDMVETAGGLLAAGGRADVYRVMQYLRATQEADGHWPQNMWLDGTPFWNGMQMDETALPILLMDLACREGALDFPRDYWPMVRKAAACIVRNGPVTEQDRWEEDPGYTPFTLAAEVAALLAAAYLADRCGEPSVAAYLRETADWWNESIERWTYVTGTDLARQVGVEGYYVRIAPPDVAAAGSPAQGIVRIGNRPSGQDLEPAAQVVSTDALALVRFGLRAPDDPRIINTVKVIDALLKVDTPYGPAWHRYNYDGYGEHEDGSPYDGTGVGRLWPLLTGERAHYELVAGRKEAAENLMHAMEAFANQGGLIPEQVWDSPDIPERGLFLGRPTGSAMPLVWAHAEYVKLRRSLRKGRVFDMPPQTVERYLGDKISSPRAVWRYNNKISTMPVRKTLRIETLTPSIVRWSVDGWQTAQDTTTKDTGLGVHLADLDTRALQGGDRLEFAFRSPGEGDWEGGTFEVAVE